MPALRREDEWKYLGIPFTPEGRSKSSETEQIKTSLEKLTKAPLKPQRRLFALRVMVLPGLYHLLSLGNTSLSRLNKIDAMVRMAVRKWLRLPHDISKAYFHGNAKDGGLSIPSMRWLMQLRTWERLKNLKRIDRQASDYLTQEIERAEMRLRERREFLNTSKDLENRWAKILHSTIDGRALKGSRKLPQQHQWIVEGNRFPSGGDYANSVRLCINAMPTRSRTARGRLKDRTCRAGCRAIETLNHVLQKCHRTHRTRMERHDAVVKYIKKALGLKYETVETEPRFETAEGLRKPDLLAREGNKAIIIDAQVVGEHVDVERAHEEKAAKYHLLKDAVMAKYRVREVSFTSTTLSYRGLWSARSAQSLIDAKILQKRELKIISSRVLMG